MKKIVLYTPYSPQTPGAAGMRVHYLRSALEAAGDTVHILTPDAGKGILLAKKIRDAKPDWVIATSPPLPPLWNVWIGAKAARAKFILDAKEDGRALRIFQRGARTLKEKAFLLLREFLYKNADACWFLTPFDQREAAEHYSLSPLNMQWVPNGVDTRIAFSAVQRTKMRKELGKISPRTPLIVYAGSVGDEALEEFLEEYVSRPRFKKGALLMVLAHDSSAEGKKIVANLHEIAADHPDYPIHFRHNAPLSQMSGFLSAADAAVLPWPDDLPTSLPVKLFDYAAAGLVTSVKAPAVGAIAEFLAENKECGGAYPEWDDFFTHLEGAMDKKYDSRERKRRAREAATKWSRETIAREAVKQLHDRFP